MQSIYLITNNPLFSNCQLRNPNVHFELRVLESSVIGILIAGRDLIHLNWELLNHPLYGNFRQGEQPFRSLLLRSHDTIDKENSAANKYTKKHVEEGLDFIEQALQWYSPFIGKLPSIDAQIHEEIRNFVEDDTAKISNYHIDCAILDKELMHKTLESAGITIP